MCCGMFSLVDRLEDEAGDGAGVVGVGGDGGTRRPPVEEQRIFRVDVGEEGQVINRNNLSVMRSVPQTLSNSDKKNINNLIHGAGGHILRAPLVLLVLGHSRRVPLILLVLRNNGPKVLSHPCPNNPIPLIQMTPPLFWQVGPT